MYLTHNEGKSVTAERFVKTLKIKIYKKVTANKSKSYLAYLKKLVYEHNNTYHHSIDESLLMVVFLLCLKKLNLGIKLLHLNFVIDSG